MGPPACTAEVRVQAGLTREERAMESSGPKQGEEWVWMVGVVSGRGGHGLVIRWGECVCGCG